MSFSLCVCVTVHSKTKKVKISKEQMKSLTYKELSYTKY